MYNCEKQLSIMLSLSATATTATAVQNPSIIELHMVQLKHNRKEPSMEDRNQGLCKSCYCFGVMPSHPKEFPIRDAECYKCRKKGHLKDSFRSKKEEKEVGRTKDAKQKEEANESPSAEGTDISRDMATTAIYNKKKTIFTERTAESDIPPYEDGAGEQP